MSYSYILIFRFKINILKIAGRTPGSCSFEVLAGCHFPERAAPLSDYFLPLFFSRLGGGLYALQTLFRIFRMEDFRYCKKKISISFFALEFHLMFEITS